jgi:hypothetical protein
MKLFHPIADGIVRPRPRRARPLRLLVVLLALSAIFGAFGARAALAADPSITLAVIVPALPGQPTILRATVTSSTQFPSGDIAFIDADHLGAPFILRTAVVSDGPLAGHADLSSAGLAARAWSVAAQYIPGPASTLSGVTSTVQTLNLASGAPTPLATQVSLTTSFVDLNPATSPIDVLTNSSVDLTATVSELVGTGTPEGTVSFSDTTTGTPVGGGPVTLVGGVAHLTVLSMGPGLHTIAASYSGGGIDNPSSSTALTFFATSPVDSRLVTDTNVVVSPSPIAAGDPATVTATIVQETAGGTVPASGGTVIFTVQGSHGYRVDTHPVTLGTGPPGFAPASNQAIVQIPSLPADTYTITASYFGNLAGNQDSADFTSLTVLAQRVSPVVSYTGAATAEFGHTATFAAQVTDHSGTPVPLQGRTVTFTLGSQHCTAVSDAAGNVACSIVVGQDPVDTTLDIDVAEDLQTQGVSIGLDYSILPEATTLTTSFSPGPLTTALTATLLTDTGAPLATQPVTLWLDLETCTATTNGAGVATCNVNTITGQTSATLSATYGGDTDHAASNASSVVQLVLTTTLAYTGPAGGVYHGATTLTARLTDGTGHPVSGRTLTFIFGTQTLTATTDASGVGSVAIASLTQHPAPLALTISYAGDAVSSGSSAAATFTIAKAPTTLTETVPVTGATTTLTATLKETSSGAPLAGKTVTLSLGTASCLPVTTSATGVAACSVTTPSGPSAVFAASFAGDADYLGSSASTTVTLLKPTAATYTGATSGEYHDLAIVSGTLLDSHGVALSGQPVTFTIGSQSCTATTSSAGKAFCLILLTQPPGSYTATMSYAGNTTYGATTASGPFTIAREDTALISQLSDAVINGNTVSLSAVLLEDYLFPVSNRTVTLRLGNASCNATTNILGYATCAVPRVATLGPTPFSATFIGDTYYLPSSTTRSTIVCAFPTGGSFVIGDRDDDSVDFWGSQWSKQNKLSHGDAPSSFKGWSSGSFDASFGNNEWSSDTGSSGTPPSTLPTYMAVIQTGSTRKSGSRIFGDTVHIVVVKTNAGYAPNAGHDGTGTIVATVQ